MNTTDTVQLTGMEQGATAATGPRLAYRITTGVFALVTAIAGTLLVAWAGPFPAAVHDLGYPAYFARLLGVAKLLGVVALVVPGRPALRQWAYAGLAFNLIGAIASHLASGDPAQKALYPAFHLTLLLTSYVLWRRCSAARAETA